MYAVLDTAPPSVLKLPVGYPATKVSALSWSIYRLPCSRQSVPAGGRMATRQLANRRIDPVLGAGNTRVDAGKVPLQPACLPDRKWDRRSRLGTPAQSMTESGMSPSLRSLHVSQSEATLRGSTETDHRHYLNIHGIAHDSVHPNRRQVRVGNAHLELQKHKVVAAGMRYLYTNALVPSTTRCA
jgi:hypothetical protein